MRGSAPASLGSEGDTNAAFFKIHAAHRNQKSRILSLNHRRPLVTDEIGLATTAFKHFSTLLGTATVRPFTIRLPGIDPRLFDLHELELPF